MFSVGVWFIVLMGILAFISIQRRKRGINLPGPFALPLIGNLLEFEQRMWMTFVKWTKKHGPLCKFSMPVGEVVLVGDAAIAREMLSMEAFVGRAYVNEFTLFEGENRGIINADGSVWEEQRRFVLRQLRDFGFGKSSMEAMTMEEVKELMERLIAKNEEPVDNVKAIFAMATVNSLWNIIAGKRFSQTDPKLTHLANQLTGAFDEAAKAGGIVAILPWIKHIIPEKSGYNAIRRVMKGMVDFIGATVQEHKESYQEDNSRDFIDAYLAEMTKTTDPSSSFYGRSGEKQLINVIADFFQGGADSISSTINWSILFLIKHPEIQKKLQAEISKVVGNSRHVSLTDRPQMIYTLAFINEVLRKANAPFGVPHKLAFDTDYRGVFLPKDTAVMFNLQYIHNDPKHWENPEEFRPERFLSEDGKSLKKNEAFFPFMLGRRMCPGENIGRDAVFLFITNLLQKFDFVEDANSPASLEPDVSFVISAKPYKVIFKERKDDDEEEDLIKF